MQYGTYPLSPETENAKLMRSVYLRSPVTRCSCQVAGTPAGVAKREYVPLLWGSLQDPLDCPESAMAAAIIVSVTAGGNVLRTSCQFAYLQCAW